MDLKQLADSLVKIGLPILGAALPLPGGATIGTALANYLGNKDASLEDVVRTISSSEEALQKAREFEASHEETLLRMQVEAETARIQAVNSTMQEEAKSDHWPTYSWRPFIGFAFGLYILSYVVLPLCGITPSILPPDLTMAIGAILGIASYYRGKMQADPNVNTDNRG